MKCPFCHRKDDIVNASDDKQFCLFKDPRGNCILNQLHAYFIKCKHKHLSILAFALSHLISAAHTFSSVNSLLFPKFNVGSQSGLLHSFKTAGILEIYSV